MPSKDTGIRYEWKWLRVPAPVVTTKHVSAVGRNVLRKGLACVFDFRPAFVLWVKNHDKHVAGAGKQGTQNYWQRVDFAMLK